MQGVSQTVPLDISGSSSISSISMTQAHQQHSGNENLCILFLYSHVDSMYRCFILCKFGQSK